MKTRKTIVGAALAATAFAGGIVGGAGFNPLSAGAEQNDTRMAAPRAELASLSLAAVAQDPSVEADAESVPEPKAHARVTTVLTDLVAEGVITQEQADVIAERLAAAHRDRIAARGERQGHMRGHRLGHAGADKLTVLTDLLGLTPEEIAAAWQDGQSIADIAAAQGVDVQTVIDTLVAEATAAIDAKVDEGLIDTERAEQAKAKITERVTAMVNQDPADRPARPKRGPRGQHTPFGGPAVDAEDTGGA